MGKTSDSIGFKRAVEMLAALGRPEQCWALLAESSPPLFLQEVHGEILRLRAARPAPAAVEAARRFLNSAEGNSMLVHDGGLIASEILRLAALAGEGAT